eukprot:751216-Hanusia_phi.AAC.3
MTVISSSAPAPSRLRPLGRGRRAAVHAGARSGTVPGVLYRRVYCPTRRRMMLGHGGPGHTVTDSE